VEMLIDLRGGDYSSVTGRILTAPELTAHNDFENTSRVEPVTFTGAKIKKNILSLTLPAKAIVVLEIR